MVILTRSVRPKELTVEVTAGGGTAKRAVTPDESQRSVLSDEEVLRLAELGIAIEREYGSPQDTEWAFDPDGKIWILQSRPVTTRGANVPWRSTPRSSG
jgi:pyruvate,water dikinase